MPDNGSSRPSTGWYLLLVIPCIALLWVPFYNRTEPSLAGIPFFYWYQFACIPVSAVITAIVHVATRSRHETEHDDSTSRSAP